MSWVDIDKVKFNIAFMKGCTDIKLLDKGYSGDVKYTFLKNDNKYLIRFNKIDKLDRAIPNLTKGQKLFIVVDYMNKALNDLVRCPKVFDYGLINQDNITYIITSFIKGDIAEVELQNMNSEKQYNAGYELGIDLNRLHQLQFPVPNIDWVKENLDPFKQKITYYNNIRDQCKIKLNENIENILMEYISKHKHLLEDREIKLIHNDVQANNISCVMENTLG